MTLLVKALLIVFLSFVFHLKVYEDDEQTSSTERIIWAVGLIALNIFLVYDFFIK
tara:strand:+ start:1926 stop:2090 length:165 start_codon:yes stop_codon:yes gene_type:complete